VERNWLRFQTALYPVAVASVRSIVISSAERWAMNCWDFFHSFHVFECERNALGLECGFVLVVATAN